MLKINNVRKRLQKGTALLLVSLVLSSTISGNVVKAESYENSSIEKIDNAFYSSSFSEETKEILKAIASATDKDIVLGNIDSAIVSEDMKYYFIAQAISSFAQEQKKNKIF